MTAFLSLPARTIARPVTIRGTGIHTGSEATVTLAPAERPGAGVVFLVRPSGGAVQEIPARASNVSDTARCTVLGGPGGASVSTVEHLLSALAGSGVTDCRVEVEGPEIPIGDGSASFWVEAIGEAGITPLGGAVEPLTLAEPILLAGANGAFVAAFPSESPRFTVAVTFAHPLVGTQVARFDPARGDAYAAAIAPARTFGFIEEVEALRAAGLARGGSFENALVIYPDRYSTPLRLPDEPARHKLLDLIGDLALAGRPLVADVVAVRPSHRLNTDFARVLETHVGDAS